MPVLFSQTAILTFRSDENAIELNTDPTWVDSIEQIRRSAVVCINFSTPTDGRGFTIARMLRERFGFTGVLRAVGIVRVDQIGLLARCGYDQFVVNSTNEAETAIKLLQQHPLSYQPCADGASDVPRHGTNRELAANRHE